MQIEKRKPLKQKTCKGCKQKFMPDRPMQSVCGFSCACVVANRAKIKRESAQATAERMQLRDGRLKLKSLKTWLSEAQTLVNRWVVKVRDVDQGCISCGTTNPNIQYCAGHYRTRGAASQHRFNLNNLAKQCNSHCNLHLSGNIVNYRPRLIEKIGLDAVIELENDNIPKKWTIDEAKSIIAEYKQKLKDAKSEIV